MNGLLPWPVLLTTLCLALAGCGGDDDEQQTSDSAKAPAAGPASPAPPEAQQELDEFAQLLETALTTPNCDGLTTKVNKLDEGSIQIVCPADDPTVAKALSGYTTTGTEAYGSGAVIDYTSAEAPKGGTWELSLGSDSTWVVDAGTITEQETAGTRLEAQGAYERVLDRFLESIREGDCVSFFRYSVTAAQDKAEACKKELPTYDALATALKADPEAKPFFIDGNARYAFFGLETSKPKPAYRTATVLKTAERANEPYLVARTKIGPEP